MFFFITNNAIAQYTITGTIQDEQTNEFLTGVAIYINDLKITTYTNQEGKFKFDNIIKGNYLLEVSLGGYKKRVENR